MERGQCFLLKASDGDESYTTVMGVRVTRQAINGEPVAVTENNTGWRELLSGAGVRSVSLSASGIFTGSEAESRIRRVALGGEVQPYELSFESGERMRGRFLVTQLEYTGDFNGERNYTVALESSGVVTSVF
jgi:predicted secreted protein